MRRAAIFCVLLLAAASIAGASWYARRETVRAADLQPRKALYYVDPMHPTYRSDKPGTAPDCGMALEPVYENGVPASSLQLTAGSVSITPEKQQLIGVQVEAVEKNSGSRLIRTTGRVAPDDNRVYRLMAGTDGSIVSLEDNPIGSVVKKNQSLA